MQKDFFGAMQSGAEQYFKGLNELGQKFMGQNASQAMPSWAQGTEQFAKLYGGGAHDGLFDQVMSQGKAFVGMLEKLHQAGQQDSQVDFSGLAQQWLGELSKQNPFMQMPGFGAVKSPFGDFDPSMFTSQHFLNMPAFGSSRESQERQTDMFKQVQAYAKAMQDYQALQLKSTQMAVDRMQSKLEERNEPGRELDSLKAVYDLWIDALEESFAEVALTAEYQKAYGNLVDAQMRVRANVQKQIELATGQVGMPTRTELEGVHLKLAELRRSFRSEIAELKGELAALKSSRKSPGAETPMAQAKPNTAKPKTLLGKAKAAAKVLSTSRAKKNAIGSFAKANK
jgi:polyhydroxyalkanoate synthase subunit PhaE